MFAHFDGFSKSVETLFGRNKEKPENVKLFEGLFAGIKKNTVLLPLINGIAAEDPKLITLLNAIQLGNVDDEIYKDRHCDIYLLRLIKDNKIDFYHGMTVYTYLTCLSQFTSRRSLLTKDKKYHSKHEMRLAKIFRDGELTESGAFYLKNMADKIKKMKGIECYDQLVEFSRTLKGSEQWIFKINCRKDESLDTESRFTFGFDKILDLPLGYNDIPYLARKNLEVKNQYQLQFGSVSLKQFCLTLITPQIVAPTFRFGVTGEETLLKLHDNALHPILLYSKHVKSNVLEAHGFPCGPVGVMLHDWIHLSWGNSLTPDFRAKIKACIHQQIGKMIEWGGIKENVKFVLILNELKVSLNDYNLLGISTSFEALPKLAAKYIRAAVISAMDNASDKGIKFSAEEISSLKRAMKEITQQPSEHDIEIISLCITELSSGRNEDAMELVGKLFTVLFSGIQKVIQQQENRSKMGANVTK